jgi:formylglycine-generating enzyme required for sulfatase activity
MGDAVGEDGCTLMSPTGPAAGMACGKYSCDEQTVKDPATALTWQRVLPVTYDGCTGQVVTNSGVPGEACAWEQAKAYCSGLSLASGGWRLPTKDELESIVDKTRKNPTIDVAAFPNTPSEDFWSATGSPGDAWLVNFDSGYSRTFIDTACYVRCVR